MTINTATLQALAAVIFTPALLSPLADVFASILAQDGFPQIVNDLIAWLVLLAAAAGSMFAANQFVGGLPAIVNVGIGVVFLLVNGLMGKLKRYCVGLDWIQSNVFDVAKGPNGNMYSFNQAKAWAGALPIIDNMFQKYLLPLLNHTHQPAAPAPTKPEPQPIVLPTSNVNNPNLNGPMSWPSATTTNTQLPQVAFAGGIQSVPTPVQNPQALPVVQPPALPAQAQPEPTSNLLQFAPRDRHWGDTGVQPALGQPTTGQG